ncbi:MAG: GspE/PulE family protein, partial [Armatimonadota bacterium]
NGPKHLSDLLVQSGKITPTQAAEADRRHTRTGEPIEHILREVAGISEEEMLQYQAAYLRTPTIELDHIRVDPKVLELVPQATAERHVVFPVSREDTALLLATNDPTNLFAIDEVQRHAGLRVRTALATESAIQRAIRKYYAGEDDEAEEEPEDEGAPDEAADTGLDLMEDLIERAPVIRIVDSILEAAVQARASDIHLERQEDDFYIRFRVDGVMYDYMKPAVRLHAPLISRIKIMANMNISERRLPQDGRFTFVGNLNEYDVRASTVPSTSGEKAVLRLLPKSTEVMQLEELGFTEQKRAIFEDLIERAFGMIIVVGPTGSGKTTTLYSALSRVDSVAKNVVTIEDPVEYEFPRVTQIQVHPKIGLTFASGLRSILRQDPDVILVGEIRDAETLTMAVQAALTGHLVFTTLHCNDTAAAPPRLIDMGLEPFLLTSSIIGFVAQRLVRRICPNCRQRAQPPPDVLKRLGLEDVSGDFYRGAGCEHCRDTGYYGRISVFEVMPLTDDIRQAILRSASASELRKIAEEQGVESLRDDGIHKARQGITTLEEVLRAVYIEQ